MADQQRHDLTPAQLRYLNEIAKKPQREYNGRALAVFNRLRDLGLVTFTLDVKGGGRGLPSFVIRATPTEAGRRFVEADRGPAPFARRRPLRSYTA